MTYFTQLAAAARQGPDTLMSFSIDRYKDFLSNTSCGLKKKGSILLSEDDNLDKASLSAVMNDLTFVSFKQSKSLSLIVPQKFSSLTEKDSMTIFLKDQDHDRISRAIENGHINVAFISSSEQFCADKLKELSPFFESGKMMPALKRGLLYVTAVAPDGTKTWSVAEADPFQPLDIWDVTKRPEADPTVPLVGKLENIAKERRLLELTVPFLSSIDPGHLSIILDDEKGLLDEFRAHIRDLTRKSLDEGFEAEEYIEDVIKPAIARVDRKFRQIMNMNTIKVGSAIVGTAAVTLASACFTGITAAVTTMIGGSGLALVTKELIAAKEAASAIKDDHMYLLWRINSLSK